MGIDLKNKLSTGATEGGAALAYAAGNMDNHRIGPDSVFHALRYGVSQVDEAHTCRASGTSMTLRTV